MAPPRPPRVLPPAGPSPCDRTSGRSGRGGVAAVPAAAALGRARGAARQTVCLAQLRQIGVAHAVYRAAHRGRPLPTNHTTSRTEVLHDPDPALVFVSPADDSPHLTGGTPVLPGVFRRASYGINAHLDPDRVSTGPADAPPRAFDPPG